MDASPIELPEFSLPERLELPAELAEQPPRDIPESVRKGPLAQRRKTVFWGTFTAAATCLLFARMPFISTLSLFILPLGYLTWIGLGLAALAVVAYLSPTTFKEACRYVEEGEVGFGRVLALAKTPTLIINKQPSTYAFVAQVQMLHPETGELCEREVKSRDFSAALKDQKGTHFRVGDAVPVIWLPDQFEKTLKIYDFLEATQESSLLQTGTKPTPLWQSLALIAAGPLLFSILFWNLYAFGRFYPIGLDLIGQGLVPFAIGGVLGLIGIAIAVFASTKHKKQAEERNSQAVIDGEAVVMRAKQSVVGGLFSWLLLAFGAVLLGGGTVLCWFFTANAMLDSSESKDVPVLITEMVQVTHSFIFREYKIEYRLADDQDEHSFMTTPQKLQQFVVPVGVAKVRNGWLGWKWVETIEPIIVKGQPQQDQNPRQPEPGDLNKKDEEGARE